MSRREEQKFRVIYGIAVIAALVIAAVAAAS
jgi:hypothetical protein